jgi:hypothetical protein
MLFPEPHYTISEIALAYGPRNDKGHPKLYHTVRRKVRKRAKTDKRIKNIGTREREHYLVPESVVPELFGGRT